MSTQTDISLFEKTSNQFKSTQTDKLVGKELETEIDKPFESQSALKQLITSLQLRNLPMAQIRPTRWFSPMDTFVAVMGKTCFYVVLIFRRKIYARKYHGLRTITSRWFCS